MNNCTLRGETKMVNFELVARIVALGINVTYLLLRNSSSRRNAPLPEKTAPPPAGFTPKQDVGFTPNQDVTVNFNGKIVAVHPVPVLPTILPYNSAIPIVNIQPVVTMGQRPLVIGGPSCAVTIYGVDAAGNLYDISSAGWMSTPRVVSWTGGTVIP